MLGIYQIRPHKTNCMDAVRNFIKRYERATGKTTHIKTTQSFYVEYFSKMPCFLGSNNSELTGLLQFKRDFAGGPQNQKMTMPDNMSSQLVSIDKVQNHLTPELGPSIRTR